MLGGCGGGRGRSGRRCSATVWPGSAAPLSSWAWPVSTWTRWSRGHGRGRWASQWSPSPASAWLLLGCWTIVEFVRAGGDSAELASRRREALWAAPSALLDAGARDAPHPWWAACSGGRVHVGHSPSVQVRGSLSPKAAVQHAGWVPVISCSRIGRGISGRTSCTSAPAPSAAAAAVGMVICAARWQRKQIGVRTVVAATTVRP